MLIGVLNYAFQRHECGSQEMCVINWSRLVEYRWSIGFIGSVFCCFAIGMLCYSTIHLHSWCHHLFALSALSCYRVSFTWDIRFVLVTSVVI